MGFKDTYNERASCNYTMSLIYYDYHTHPNLMRVPENGRAYIETAIQKGLREICFTDHAPLEGFPLGDRMPVGMARQYCETVRTLADEYKDRIVVKCGIEMDYLPTIEDQIEDILNQADFDYVIGSSHLHCRGMLPFPLSDLTAQEFVVKCFENNLMAVKSGYFNTIAHIDMYRWVIRSNNRFNLKTTEFDLAAVEYLVREIFAEMEKREVSLEVNTHLMASTNDAGDIYPSTDIMKIARDYELRYKFGSDAHVKEHVGIGRDIVENEERFRGCFI